MREVENITIPAYLEQHIIFDGIVENQGRMIAYCSDFGHQVLVTNATEISIDGTFQVGSLFFSRHIDLDCT